MKLLKLSFYLLGAAILLLIGIWLIFQTQNLAKENTTFVSSQQYTTQQYIEPAFTPENATIIQPNPILEQESTPEVENPPPPCTILATFSKKGSTPIPIEHYQFSEPEIVYRSSSAIGIAGWLPDNKRLLITRSTTNGFQAIETFDYITQETTLYAERNGEGGKPVWLSSLNAVAYATFVEDHEELLISYGHPLQPQIIAQDIFSLSLASMDTWLMFFSPETGDQPVVWDSQQKYFRTISVNLENLAYSKFGKDKPIFNPIPGKTFSIAIQPGLKKAVFFGHALFFLANLENGEICELDLGEIQGSPRWMASVQWSSDGRFLAMKTWDGFPGQIVPANRLLVLDILTGEEYYPEIPSGYIYDLVWEPDHHMLAALGNLETIDGRAKMGLFLIGVDEKKVKRILPEKIFGGGEIGKLAWGQGKIAIDCTSWPASAISLAEGRVCIINVMRNP